MANREYSPTTPSRRGMTQRSTAVITKTTPTKSLVGTLPARSGRNHQGRVTIRHRGGGVKRRYRLVNFKTLEGEVKVQAIEYDPYRSANIALVQMADGQPAYILAGAGMKVGQIIKSGLKPEVKPGNRLPLKQIPAGSTVYNIELSPGRGGQLVRSAGASARLAAKDEQYAHLRLPSGEVRRVRLACYATLGSVGNSAHQNIKWGNAGRRRRLGRRPSVRGKAMNPVDHHMGGGEGKSGPGRLPTTPWGKLAIGKKTRRRKDTGKYIIRNRKKGRR